VVFRLWAFTAPAAGATSCVVPADESASGCCLSQAAKRSVLVSYPPVSPGPRLDALATTSF